MEKGRKTIKSRWIKNILAVTIAVLIALALTILYSVYTRYITTAELTVRARLSSTVDNFFSYYNTNDENFFALGANDFVENFAYKDIMELLVLDKNGETVVSSNAFGASVTSGNEDYSEALVSYNCTGMSVCKTVDGERVLALSYILRNDTGENYGALRYLVSLEDAYKQFFYISLLVILFFGLIITFLSISGRYFVSSIVRPLEKINSITKVIARGDFSVRLNSDTDDEIGELSESINEMTSRLKEAEAMKNDFISTVSHEIRTPLTAIKGWGETLKNINNNPDLTSKGLDIIISETERLSDMVEELLDFSRMQNGNMKFNFEAFNIVEVLDEVYLTYKQKAETENKQLTKFYDSESCLLIKGDEGKIRQVLINIADNALKYSDESSCIKIGLERNEKYVTIYFIDNGRGISEKDLPHIKEKFYKADNTVRGTGIGLAVADEIIKQHNGNLNIRSKIGEGTVAEIVLPVWLTEEK